MIIVDIEQRSPEWYRLKAGVLSASNFGKIITPTGRKAKSSYVYQVAGEKKLGMIEEGYSSNWMQRGIDLEDEAREAYAFITGREVKQVGFVFKDEKRRVGCSPDGLMEGRGLEIKCLKLSNHVSYLAEKTMPSEYIPQVQGCMYVTGFKEWDFMLYYPGLEPLILTVKRDEEYLVKMDRYIKETLREIDEILARI